MEPQTHGRSRRLLLAAGGRCVPAACSPSRAPGGCEWRQRRDSSSAPLAVGQVLEQRRAFDQQAVDEFLRLTGDANPIHAGEATAGEAGLPTPVVPGILVAALFPALIGSRCPGSLYLTQRLRFPASALVRDGRGGCRGICDGAGAWQLPARPPRPRRPAAATAPDVRVALSSLKRLRHDLHVSHPSPGCNPLPCQVGERLLVTVALKRSSGRRFVFDTIARAEASGRVVAEGEALALLPAKA